MVKKEPKKEPISPEELISWRDDPRGKPFWDALRTMGNVRMSAIRNSLMSPEYHKASQLNGELNMVEEVLQLPELLIQEQKLEENDELEAKT